MQGKGFTGRLACFSSRRPKLIIAIWALLFVAGMATAVMFPAEMATDATFTGKPESIRAQDMIDARMDASSAPRPREFAIVSSETLTVDDPAFQTFLASLTSDIVALGEYTQMALNPLEAGDPSLVSENRHAAIIPVFKTVETANSKPYLDLIANRDGQDGFTVVTGGQDSIDDTFVKTSEHDLLTGETIGVSVAMLVLVIVFGTLVAAGVPLVMAIVAITLGLGITMIVGHLYELSIFSINMLIMIGLAVGIDYSLFIVGRYREERDRGLHYLDAIVRAGESATKAVVFSGLTVVTALVGMLLIPTTIFHSLGIGAIIVVLLTLGATLTLLPAGLAVMGDRIEWGQGRTLFLAMAGMLLFFAWVFTRVGTEPIFSIAYVVLAIIAIVLAVLNKNLFQRTSDPDSHHFWNRVAHTVMRRPVVILVTSVIVLAALASAYSTIQLGQMGISTLPESSSPRRAFVELATNFPRISLEDPNVIVINGDANAPDIQQATERLEQALANDPDFGPTFKQVNSANDLTTISVPSTHDTNSTESVDSIKRVRSVLIPEAFNGVNAEVLVSGQTAFTLDFNTLIADYTPYVFAFVLTVSFILLMLAFRSLIVPLKSVLMNLLSVGASYGLLVLVFQHGYGHNLFGFTKVEHIDAWVPLLMFCVLFGLSMDYHVFLLSRIREHYDQSRDNRASVAFGLRSTAGMITGAALIMVAVFGGFAMGTLTMFQQMGFGLAVAVILDATIIRILVVPSAMALLGDRNWYFPKWLEWLPTLHIEGPRDEGIEITPAPGVGPAVVAAAAATSPARRRSSRRR